MLRRTNSTASDGFTVIELIVGMILLMIAAGMATVALVQSTGNHKQGTQQRKLVSKSSKAIDQLRIDVGQAQSPAREALAEDELTANLKISKLGALDARDVLVATPWTIKVRTHAQIENTAGTTAHAQCVTWYIQGGWLRRRVQSGGIVSGSNRGWQPMSVAAITDTNYKNCRGGTLTDERMAPVATYVDYKADSTANKPLRSATSTSTCAASTDTSATNTACLEKAYAPIFTFTELVNDTPPDKTDVSKCVTEERPAYWSYQDLPTKGDSADPPYIPGTPAYWTNDGAPFTFTTSSLAYYWYYWTTGNGGWSWNGPYSGSSSDWSAHNSAVSPYTWPNYSVSTTYYNGQYAYWMIETVYPWWPWQRNTIWSNFPPYYNQVNYFWNNTFWGYWSVYQYLHTVTVQKRKYVPAVAPVDGARIAHLNRITSVHADLRIRYDKKNPPTVDGIQLTQPGFASSSLKSTINIETRQSLSYMRALGCAE